MVASVVEAYGSDCRTEVGGLSWPSGVASGRSGRGEGCFENLRDERQRLRIEGEG